MTTRLRMVWNWPVVGAVVAILIGAAFAMNDPGAFAASIVCFSFATFLSIAKVVTWEEMHEGRLSIQIIVGIAAILLFGALLWGAVHWRVGVQEEAVSIPPLTVTLKAPSPPLQLPPVQLPPQIIYRDKGSISGSDVVKRGIQEKLGAFVAQGVAIREGWLKVVVGPEDAQRQSAIAVQKWHTDVANYLHTIPRGTIYLVRFQNQLRPSGSYPIGMNMNVGGNWDLLMSDLARLNEILTDSDLGSP